MHIPPGDAPRGARPPIETELLATSELPEPLRQAIHALDQRTAWGNPPDGRSLVWGGNPSWVVVVRTGGQLVSHVGIVDREVLVGAQPTQIAGITSVMTEAAFQGRGYATAALRQAENFIRTRMPVPFALLTCLEHRRTFYEERGWRTTASPVYCEQPEGKTLLTTPGRWVMTFPVSSDTQPDGPVDLCGLPW